VIVVAGIGKISRARRQAQQGRRTERAETGQSDSLDPVPNGATRTARRLPLFFGLRFVRDFKARLPDSIALHRASSLTPPRLGESSQK
jgi:hypothetical protein